jgi:hypothetical protein
MKIIFFMSAWKILSLKLKALKNFLDLFKRGKVISVIKPGKDETDPAHYRPISLLSVGCKLLERLILQRIQPLIEDVTPINQAGFRQHRICTEQVMALTMHIEASFQHQLKTGAWFVNLTAAYDIVCREGLMMKFLQAVPCLKPFNLLNNILLNRYFQVFLGDQSSRWRRLNTGLPQGSVLAPILSTFICGIYHLLLRSCFNTLMTLL